MRIYEDEDGHISIRHGEVELAARAFPKVGGAGAGVTPGAIADNKLLAAALSHVREQQQIREQELLAKARTRRERRLRTESLDASGLEK